MAALSAQQGLRGRARSARRRVRLLEHGRLRSVRARSRALRRPRRGVAHTRDRVQAASIDRHQPSCLLGREQARWRARRRLRREIDRGHDHDAVGKPACGRVSPAGAVDAQFSLPYTVATALDRQGAHAGAVCRGDTVATRGSRACSSGPGSSTTPSRRRRVLRRSADRAGGRAHAESTAATLRQPVEFSARSTADRPAPEIERKLHDLAGGVTSA